MTKCVRCERRERVMADNGLCLRCWCRDLLGKTNPGLAEDLREHWARLDERDRT